MQHFTNKIFFKSKANHSRACYICSCDLDHDPMTLILKEHEEQLNRLNIVAGMEGELELLALARCFLASLFPVSGYAISFELFNSFSTGCSP